MGPLSRKVFASPIVRKVENSRGFLQVLISGLVSLSLVYGSGVHYLILKEPQFGNIGKQINRTLSYKN